MNRKVRNLIIVVLSVILLYSSVRLVMIQLAYKQADEIYAESRAESFHVAENISTPQPSGSDSAAKTEPEDYFPEAYADIEELQKTNPDVIGWLWIPDTDINFPLLRATNNYKYLSLSYNLIQSNSGSIFMDFRNAEDLSDDNSILFGHNMKNGGMFGSLKAYGELDYLQDHAYAYIFTADRILKYRIFAAYKTESTSESYTRSFSDAISYDAFMAYLTASAGENMTELPETQTPLLMLSTCTSERRTERFVVHGALIAEKPLGTDASAP